MFPYSSMQFLQQWQFIKQFVFASEAVCANAQFSVYLPDVLEALRMGLTCRDPLFVWVSLNAARQLGSKAASLVPIIEGIIREPSLSSKDFPLSKYAQQTIDAIVNS